MKQVILALILLSAGLNKASGAVLFETNFDSSPDWNVNNEYGTECGYPCATAPSGWDATRMVKGNAQFVYPTGSIQHLPGGLPDHTSGSGKTFLVYNESNSTLNWPGDSLLLKVLPQDQNELYIRLWVRTQAGWQWMNGASASKLIRVMHYDRTGNIYQYFSAGSVAPAYIWDLYYSTVYGVRLSNSYRCSPQSTQYECPGSPGGDGDGPPDNSLWPGASYPPTTTPLSPGMFADTAWHRVDLHIKLNSAPGVNDGIMEYWWDVPTMGAATPLTTSNPASGVTTKTYANHGVYFGRTNIQWMASVSDTARGWNTIGLGGNANNSFSGSTNGEQWYAFDDLVVSNSPIPADYIIGGVDTSSPTAPSGLAASNVTGSGFTLGWTAATDNVGVTGYRLDVSLNSGFSSFVSGYNNLDLGNVTSKAVAGLAASTQYYARVRAYDAAGNVSANSASASAATAVLDTTAPSVPGSPATGIVTSSGIVLSWTASTDNVGVAGYSVYRCQGAGCTPTTRISTVAANSYSDTGLMPNTAYGYVVEAYDAAGNTSSKSGTVSAATQIGIVFVQVNAGLQTSASAHSVAFTRNTAAGNIIVVGVGWVAPATFTSITDNRGNTYTLAGSEAAIVGPNYSIKSRVYYARNISGGATTVTVNFNSATYSDVYAHEYAGADPVSPLDAAVQAGGTSSAVNSGNAAVTGNKDLIFGFSFGFVASGGAGFATRSTHDGALTQDKLVNVAGTYNSAATGTDAWTMHMVALRSAGDGVADTTAPGAPSGLAASNISSAAFTLGWTASTDNVGVAGYRLDVSLASGFGSFVTGYNNLDVGNVTSKVISGLAAATTYYARVRAYDAAGNVSGNSASVSATTTAGLTAPGTVGDLTVLSVSSNSVTLSFTEVSDGAGQPASYDVRYSVGPMSWGSALSVTQGTCSTPLAGGTIGALKTCTITGLSPSTAYGFQLVSFRGTLFVDVVFGGISNETAGTTSAVDTTSPTTPSGLAASNISSAAFTLGWTASTDNVGVAGYRLDVSLNSGFTTFVPGYSSLDVGNVTLKAITGLSASTPYYARLRAYDAAGNVSANQTPLLTTTLAGADVTPPNAPSGVAASNISDTGYTLGWTAATDNVGVTGYRLDVSLNSGFTTFVTGYSNKDLGNVVSAAVTGLSASTPYYARLRAYDAAGNVSANQTPLLTTTQAGADVTPPNAPTGLAASNISDTGYTLGWTAATDNVGVTGYRLDVSLNSGFTTFVPGYSNKDLGNAASTVITGLSASTLYYARLRAYDAAGNVSANQTPLLTTTQAGPDVISPNVPSGLVASNISDTGYTLGWTAATDNVGVTGYRLDVSLNSGFSSFVAGYSNLNLGNVTSIAITGLSAQTPYYARLRAYDAAGNASANSVSNWTTTLAAPDVTAPNAPTGLVASNVSETAYTLGWTAATDNVGVTGYRLDVSLNSGFTSFVPGYNDLNLGNVLSASVTGLSANTPYYARLRAYDAAGNVSANQGVLLTSTLLGPDTTPPGAPTGLSADNISDSGFTLVWSAAADNVGVTGYRLDVSLNSGFTSFVSGYSNLNLGNVTSAGITGLSASTPYYARLRAYDAAGNVSANSASKLVTMLAGPDVLAPNAPTGLVVSNVTAGGFTLVWSAAADNVGVTGYRLDVSLNSGFTSFVAGYSNLNLGEVTTSAISGLSAGTPYYARLRAYDAAGNVSANSASAWTTTSAAGDATVPVVAISAPAAGATVTGVVAVTAAASDNVGVARVEFYVDSILKNTDTTAPYSFALDTTLLANGSRVIAAKAYDAVGNSAQASVTVTVGNSVVDVTPPAVAITSPANGAEVSGKIYLNVSASDANGVSRVEFYVDNVIRNTDPSAPYSYLLNTLKFTNGVHVISARAYDTGNNMAAASVSVNIQNYNRTDKEVAPIGSVVTGEYASVTILPAVLPETVVVSVVAEQMDDDVLLAERDAKARTQRLTPVAGGVRVLPEGYSVASPIKVKLPVKRGITVSASLESVLGIYAWDAGANAWTPLASTYDAADDTMNADAYDFSVYKLFSTLAIERVADVGKVYVFPNPAKSGAKPVFHIETETADKVEIKVLDFTGRVIHKKTLTGGPVLVNRNGQLVYAYEYEWDAKNAASGAYFYAMTISRNGGETKRKGKFAIIR